MYYKNLKTYSSSFGDDRITSNVFSSMNFDGLIFKEKLKVTVSALKSGDILYLENPEYLENPVSFIISRIQVDNGLYYIYYPGEFSFEDQLTSNSPNPDGSYVGTEEFYVLRENKNSVNLGTTGWALTSGGTAIFTDVIARGEIQATSGEIEGVLTVGRDLNNDPLMKLGSNIFADATFDGISAKQNGLLINANNYLLSYESSTSLIPTSVVVSSSNTTTLRRLVSVTVPNHTFALIDSSDRTQAISFSGISGTGNINLLNDKTFIIETIVGNVISFYAYLDITTRTSQSLSGTVIKSGPFDTMTMTTVTVADSPVTETLKTVKFNFASNHSILDTQTVTFAGFSSTLESLNDTAAVTFETNTQISISSYFITIANGTYTSGIGGISYTRNNAKFKVGSSTNFMKYDSYLDTLTVTGRINALAGGTIGGFDIFSDRLVDTGAKQVEIIPDTNNAITVYQNQYDGVEVNKTGVITSKQLLSYEDVLNDDSVVVGQTITGKVNVNYNFITSDELSVDQYISTLINPQYGSVEDFQISSISVTALNTFTVNTVQNHGFTAGQPIYLHNPRLDPDILDDKLYIASYASSGTTRTIGTGVPHNLLPGDTVIISNGKYLFDVDEAFDGTFIVRSTPTTTSFTYIASTALTLATQSLLVNITNRQTSGGIATITTSVAHGLLPGDSIYVYDLTSSYNGFYTVDSTPSTTQVSYLTGNPDESLTTDSGTLIITATSDWENSSTVFAQSMSGFLKVLASPTATSFTISKSTNTATTSASMTYPGNEVGINTFFSTILLDQLEKTMKITDIASSYISIDLGEYSAYTSAPSTSTAISLLQSKIDTSNITKEITYVSISKAASNTDYPGIIMSYNGSFGGSLSTWDGSVSIDNSETGDAGYIWLALPRKDGLNYSYYGDLTLKSEDLFLETSKASVSTLGYKVDSNIHISPDVAVSIENVAPDSRYYLSNLASAETRVPGYSLQIESSKQITEFNETENKVMRFSPNQIQVTDVYNEVASTLSIQPYGGTTAFGGLITTKGITSVGTATITGSATISSNLTVNGTAGNVYTLINTKRGRQAVAFTADAGQPATITHNLNDSGCTIVATAEQEGATDYDLIVTLRVRAANTCTVEIYSRTGTAFTDTVYLNWIASTV